MGRSPTEYECGNAIKSKRCTSIMNHEGAQLQTIVFYWPTIRCRNGIQLLRLSVATTTVVLLGAIRSPREGLKRNLGGLFARLLEVTVVAPQVGSVFAPLDNDAAGPGCPDTCALKSGTVLGNGGIRKRAHLEDRSSPGTVVGQFGWRCSSLKITKISRSRCAEWRSALCNF